jgi:P-type E1-E2 ATPase
MKDILWSEVKVGEIVRVDKDEEIPADMLIIHSIKDVVFISTMNLDGETNLKERILAFDNINETNMM